MLKHGLLQRKMKAKAEQWIWNFVTVLKKKQMDIIRNEIFREVGIQNFFNRVWRKMIIVW
jgi:hypothetical protein